MIFRTRISTFDRGFASVQKDLKYADSHEWVKVDGKSAVVGITDHAQDHLGNVVYGKLPKIGTTVTQGNSFGSVESVRATCDINSRVLDEVVEVNEELKNSPGLLVMKSGNQFPRCEKLKVLGVRIHLESFEDLFCFAPLIKACPFLHKFVQELGCLDPAWKRKLLKKEECPHYHMKIIEIVGFVGNATDLEFILYLMKNCVALEKIVINPCRLSDIGAPWEFGWTQGKY